MRRKGVESVKVFAGYMTIDLRDEMERPSTRERSNHVARASTPSTRRRAK